MENTQQRWDVLRVETRPEAGEKRRYLRPDCGIGIAVDSY